MSKTATIFTRVDPNIKLQAENVLNKLGISMATAIEIYLRQIALQRKIPFGIKLPEINKPISLEALTDEQFDELMNQAAKSYANRECTDFNDFKSEIKRDLGLWANGK